MDKMDNSDCHSEKMLGKAVAFGKPNWGWIFGQTAVSAFLTAFLYTTFAVPAIAVFLGFPVEALTIYEYGALNGVTLFVLGMIFYPYGGWIYFSPSLALTDVLCCEERRWGAVGKNFGKMLVGLIMSLGGYFLAFWIDQNVYERTLRHASPVTHIDWFGDFYLETLGITIVCLSLVLTPPDPLLGFVRVATVAAAQGVLTTLIYPVTGGSLNFWRTLSVGALVGNLHHVGWGSKLVALFVGPILAGILKLVLSRGAPFATMRK